MTSTSVTSPYRGDQVLQVCGVLAEYLNSVHTTLELELIQTQMTQKPMLRAEVYARALRASQKRKEDSS